jgi:GntR family transcriptional regulator
VNNTFQPVYYAIAEDIKKSILAGDFNPGDIVPSENELALKYKTSRITARKGLSKLEREGLISVWHGKGYYVLNPEHNKFTLYINENNSKDRFKYGKVTVSLPDTEIKEALNLEEEQKVILVSRIVLNNNIPVAFEEKYMPYERGRPLIEEEIKYADLPEIAATKVSPFTIRTEMEISADFGPAHVVKALECSPSEPMLILYRYIVGKHDAVFGYAKLYMLRNYGKLKASSGYDFVKR